MKGITLDLQLAYQNADTPKLAQFKRWVELALTELQHIPAELTIRVVDIAEMTQLNETYRKKAGPTNVLSFPFSNPPGVKLPLLGDIIICGDIISNEAKQQHKAVEAHWAHMVVHGCLHLLNYDHLTDEEAAVMEPLEIKLLAALGYDNPYLIKS